MGHNLPAALLWPRFADAITQVVARGEMRAASTAITVQPLARALNDSA